jgi:lipopolysaccharide transport system ATP-binding protein
MSLIEVNNVSKDFGRHNGRKLLRHKIADMFRPKPEDEYFHALRDVSFTVEKGQAVALIGGNGAGKSTMLSVVTGLAQPTRGTVKVRGRVAALLELGSGFHPDLSGRENVFVNAALLGLSRKEVTARFDDIVEFSGIREFIGEPTRTYSSGMLMRLAFAVIVHVDPAILIVDEVLAVGDSGFQEKCLKKVVELRKKQTTMLCASHSSAMVTNFCDRAIWLYQGQVVLDGPSSRVMQAYLEYGNDPAKGFPRVGGRESRPQHAMAR